MKVKKFIAATMPEAMKRVRKELGTDAVILNSKEIYQGGFLGLFKKRKTEVIAALDPQPKPEKKGQLSQTTAKVPDEKYQSLPANSSVEIFKEIQALKNIVERNGSNRKNSYPDAFQELYEFLISQEVTEKLAQEIIDSVIEVHHEEKGSVTKSMTKKWLQSALLNRLNRDTFGGINYDKKFVHLVGPTGVGKTTTIAKIAASSVLNDKKSVALITTDTYRIAAIEQLKTYSKILDVPMEIAYSVEDYKKAREKFIDYDLVLVDTAGRNFRDPKYVKELGKIIDLSNDIDTYLVLSLTTRSGDIENIFNQFTNIPLKQLVLTKKDETSKYGAIINLCLNHDIGVAYITDGQDVPDDISEATPEKVGKMIGEEYPDE